MNHRLTADAPADRTAKHARFALCVILVLGLALRVLATLSQPMGINLFSDDNAYLNSAAVFAKTGYVTYARPDTQSGVLGAGMPLLLGFLFAVFGYQATGLVVSHIVFASIGLITAVGGYWLGRLLCNRRVGVLLALLLALSPGQISLNSAFYTETPYLCFNLFAFVCFVRCARDWSLKSFLLGILCLCGAAAFKGLALLTPLMALPLLWRRKVPLKRWVPLAGIVMLSFVLVFAPWTVRNGITLGTYAPFPISQGDQKLLGTYVGIGMPSGDYQQDVDALNAAAWDEGYQTDVLTRLTKRGELADARTAQWLHENPIGYGVTHLLYKPLTLLSMSFYPQKLFGIPARAVQLGWWGVLALALWGLWCGKPLGRLGAKRKRRQSVAAALTEGDVQTQSNAQAQSDLQAESDVQAESDAQTQSATQADVTAPDTLLPGLPQQNPSIVLEQGNAAYARPLHPMQAGFYLPALYLMIAVLLTAFYVPLARYNAPHAPFVMFYAAVALDCLLEFGARWFRTLHALKSKSNSTPTVKNAKP